jgi:class 3 adenylate cyclase
MPNEGREPVDSACFLAWGSRVIARLQPVTGPTGVRGFRGRGARRDRFSATLLFGDWPAGETASHARGFVRTEFEAFDGDELFVSEDGFAAMFRVPLYAVRCGVAIRDEAHDADVPVRMAVHTGRVEFRGSDVCGPAVHLSRRLLDVAGPGELIMTPAVVGLSANSELRFTRRGVHRLDGVPGFWRLFAADEGERGDRTFNPVLKRVSGQV